MNDATTNNVLASMKRLLHRPIQLGLVLNMVLLTSWYLATHSPMQRAIDEDEQRLSAERERLALAREVEQLRSQAQRYGSHLPDSEDGDIWIPFLMGGVRQFPIKLVALEPRPPVDVGPFTASVHRMVVEGSYSDLEQFLRWLEGSPRMIRVESIQIITKAMVGNNVAPGATTNEMQLFLMGLEG